MCKTCGDVNHVQFGRNKRLLEDPLAPHDGAGGGCRICDELPIAELLELNSLMGDPANWPANWAGDLEIPAGLIPPQYRRWGAVRLCKAWAADHRCKDHPNGHKFHDKTIRAHYHRHVTQLPQNLEDIAALGAGDGQSSRLPALTRNPITFRTYMAKGLEIGYFALEQLQLRIQDAIDEGEYVSPELLLKLADYGIKISTSQAALVMRGMELSRDKDEEIESFRAGADGLPSQRMGHSRIRVIDGEARPVVDEGRADRRDFNERAKAEGSTTLPA